MKQVLLTSLDLYKHKSEFNINHNVLIQDNIITKDFSKIIKALFIFHNEAYHPNKLLYECVEISEIVNKILILVLFVFRSIFETKKAEDKNEEKEEAKERRKRGRYDVGFY